MSARKVAAAWVLSLEIGIAGLTSMTLGFLGRGRPTRCSLLAVTAFTVLGSFISASLPSLRVMLVVRAALGVCEGVLIAAVNESVARTDFPEKRFGQVNALMNLMDFLMVISMPLAMSQVHMVGAVFVVLGAATLLCMPFVALYPDIKVEQQSPSAISGLGGWRGWLTCTALLLSASAVGSFYPVTESLGRTAGISSEMLGPVLSLAFVGAFVGSYWASWFDARLGVTRGAVFVAVGLTAAVQLLIHAHGSGAFGVGMLLIGIFWFHGLVTCLGLAASVDPNGGAQQRPAVRFFSGVVLVRC